MRISTQLHYQNHKTYTNLSFILSKNWYLTFFPQKMLICFPKRGAAFFSQKTKKGCLFPSPKVLEKAFVLNSRSKSLNLDLANARRRSREGWEEGTKERKKKWKKLKTNKNIFFWGGFTGEMNSHGFSSLLQVFPNDCWEQLSDFFAFLAVPWKAKRT